MINNCCIFIKKSNQFSIKIKSSKHQVTPMKTLSRYLYLFSFTLLLSACGGGKGGPNSNAGSGGSSGSNGSIPNIDSSKPLMEQFQQIFSNLKPGSDFYGVKITFL